MKFSSRLLRKGTLIPETRLVFQRWRDDQPVAVNIQAALADNPTGARQLSAYHDRPYVLFQCPPDQEFPLRQELALLRTRLEQAGKRITLIIIGRMLDRCAWTPRI
ncbi:MAG: hypothetical protein LM550_16795 [Candidatus Contendobacter sp.]|jgi:hypothetical protein|nr:hypothetical protein [Gammaproteobacteria bacterium]MCC8995301.1 hypothetical protein [Candidatus Contendobacter sp.]